MDFRACSSLASKHTLYRQATVGTQQINSGFMCQVKCLVKRTSGVRVKTLSEQLDTWCPVESFYSDSVQGYHGLMRIPASIRMVLLATLLAASQVAFAAHVTAHLNTNISNCEWCVCQAQTSAGPLPVFAPVIVERPAGELLQPPKIPLFAEPASTDYQPRAPPVLL